MNEQCNYFVWKEYWIAILIPFMVFKIILIHSNYWQHYQLPDTDGTDVDDLACSMSGSPVNSGRLRYTRGRLVHPSQYKLCKTASKCLHGRKRRRQSTDSHDGTSALLSLLSLTMYCLSVVSTLVTTNSPLSDITMLSGGMAVVTGGIRFEQWSRKKFGLLWRNCGMFAEYWRTVSNRRTFSFSYLLQYQ